MKKLANLLSIPGAVCFIALLGWSEEIKAYSFALYIAMMIVLGAAFFTGQIQIQRNRDESIGKRAVNKFKADHGIAD